MKNTETGNQTGKEGCNTHSTFSAKVKVNCSENIQTYYKATVRANHVPCSVVLHQDGVRVIGTLNSWKAQSISTTEAKQQLNDHNSSKNMKNKNSNWQLNLNNISTVFLFVFSIQQTVNNTKTTTDSQNPFTHERKWTPHLVITDPDVGFGSFVLQHKQIFWLKHSISHISP